jgi:topoisomerase-4 subunit A
VLSIEFEKPRGKAELDQLEVNAEEFISVKGFKALGNQLSDKKIKNVILKEALEYEIPEELDPNDIEVEGEEAILPDKDDSQIKLEF